MNFENHQLIDRTFLRELAGIFYHDFANILTVLKTRSAMAKKKLSANPNLAAADIEPFFDQVSTSTDRMNNLVLAFRNRDEDFIGFELNEPLAFEPLVTQGKQDFTDLFPHGKDLIWFQVPVGVQVNASPRRLRLAMVILGLAMISSPQPSWAMELENNKIHLTCRGLTPFKGPEIFNSEGHPFLEYAVIKKIFEGMNATVSSEFLPEGCQLEILIPTLSK